MAEREIPDWIKEFKKRIELIEIIERAYLIDCECEVCKRLRELGKELGKMFKLPEVTA